MEISRSRRAPAGAAITPALVTAAALAALAGCSPSQGEQGASGQSETVYVANLAPLNTTVTGGAAAGEVTFTITGDSLTIATNASGVPKDIAHWQHFHGFTDGRQSACPGESADANGDGIVDLIETEPAAGTTMVPFNDDPAAMDVPRETYPKASATGTLEYRETVSLGALESAFGKAFEGGTLDLDKRVVFLHGVPSDTKLAGTVASLGPIPAHVTLPIACGEIARVK